MAGSGGLCEERARECRRQRLAGPAEDGQPKKGVPEGGYAAGCRRRGHVEGV